MNGLTSVFISAGEASGDTLGAAIAKELLLKNPRLDLWGIGGDKMRACGVKTVFDIKDLSVVGISAVFKLPKLYKIRRAVVKIARQKGTKIFCGVDYPGFNVNLAGAFKKLGARTICYKAPSIYAWGEWRVKEVKKNVDFVAAIFPFEADAYLRHGVSAEYVGNPMIDNVKQNMTTEDIYLKCGISADKRIIALLPGSRSQEVSGLLPEMLKAAAILNKEIDNLHFVIPKALTIDLSEIDGNVKKFYSYENISILTGNAYDVMRQAYCGIAASGTATLESALSDLPVVIVYKLSWITYRIAKLLATVKFVGMPNLVLGEQVLPELLQSRANACLMAQELKKFLCNSEYYDATKKRLLEVKALLNKEGAGKRVAGIISEYLEHV